jgi:phage gp29-like protein
MSDNNDRDQDVQLAVPALPEKGEVVKEESLYLTQIANYRNTLAFSGAKNPTSIWQSMVRDDTNAIIYLRELEEKDEDVADALDSLKYSVMKRDRAIEPGDDSQAAIDAADFIQDQIDALPNFDDALDMMLDAPGYGFSVQEMIFDVSMGQASLTDIKDRPQELFLFGQRFRPQIGPLQLLDSPWAMNGTPMPEEKFIVCTYRGRGCNRMGRPLLRSVFWPSWFKRNVLGFWLRRSERAQGTAVTQYPQGASEDEKQLAASVALAMIENVAISVPQNFPYDAELLKSSQNITADLYEHLHQQMQYAIVRRILGQTLTSFGGESGKGTQALGNVHQDTKNERSVAIAKTLMSTINRSLVRPLVLWNFGPDVPMPKWKIMVDEKEDLGAKAETLKVVQSMGVPMTVEFLQNTFDVPKPQEGEEVASPTAPVPPPGAQPPNPAEFSERQSVAERDAQVERELKQIDQVVNQLKDAALDDFKTRIREVADATTVVQ